MNAQQAILRAIESLEWRINSAESKLATDGHWIGKAHFDLLTGRIAYDKETIEVLRNHLSQAERTYYPEVVEK